MSALPEWLAEWWRGMDTGLSSRAIAVALAESVALLQITPTHDLCPPSDTSDVGRCVRLLDLAAENGCDWRARLPEVVRISPKWASLIPRWAEIEAAYHEDVAAQNAHARAVYISAKGRRLRVKRKDVPFPPSRCWWIVATTTGRYDPYDRVTPHPFAASGAPDAR